MHATILAYMFTLVETGKISVALGQPTNNILFIQVEIVCLARN